MTDRADNSSIALRVLIRNSRLALGLWSLLLLLMFALALQDHWKEAEQGALIEARALIEKDKIYRMWNAMHGGVYAPVTDNNPPNPYLTSVPERDIISPSGRRLTLINPAYMTRQVHELEGKSSGSLGHITSLKLMRPENKPDAWEERALRSFDQGNSEVHSKEVIEKITYMRVMQPLRTELACLKCHGSQGYHEGDIRGALSASIPMRPFYAAMYTSIGSEGLRHLVFWMVGAILIVTMTRREETKNISLRESERKYRELVEHANSIILRWDRDGMITFINEFGQRFFGYREEELLGKHVVGTIVPETESTGRDLQPLMKEICLEPKKFENNINENMRQNGERVWISWTNKVSMDNSGNVSEILSIGSDITQLKRTEDQLRSSMDRFQKMSEEFNALLDAIPDSITLLSPELSILWANESAAQRVFLDSYSMTGRRCYDLWFSRSAPCDPCPALVSCRSGDPTVSEVVTAAGRIVEVRIVPVKNTQGSVISLIRVGRDITDQRKMDEEQKKLQEQLALSQKIESLGRLAGGVAHDFNNILSAIIGYSDLAMMKLPQESPVYENIKIIKMSGEKAAALTHQLLAFSRKQMLQMNTLDIGDVIGEMLKMLSRIIREDVTIDIDVRATRSIEGDRGQIGQILLNLAINASDAMPSGGKIFITTQDIEMDAAAIGDRKEFLPGSYVHLAIRDSGTGMDEKTLARIFEPFFTTKALGKGTGMGLATVYGIVKQHRGYIYVSSELGQGTTFRIYFPISNTKAVLTSQHDQELRGGDETIFVVDDDAAVLNIVNEILLSVGYRVVCASGTSEALHISGSFDGTLDLILTDVIMPGMNGKDLSTRLLEEHPKAKVVYMSGYTDDAIVHHGVLDKGVHLIQKPISYNSLVMKVREVLDERGHSVDGIFGSGPGQPFLP